MNSQQQIESMNAAMNAAQNTARGINPLVNALWASPDQPTKTFRLAGEGPRWAKVPSFLRDLAWRLNLRIEIETEKGWFRERVRARVHGPVDAVKEFERQYDDAVRDYNAR